MSNTTRVCTKREFIDLIEKTMTDDQVALWTNNINTIELKPKFNEKRVTLGFAADAFERSDGVGDLMKLNGYLIGVAICDKSILSDGAKDILSLRNSPKKRKRS